jgi:hypothetical protein
MIRTLAVCLTFALVCCADLAPAAAPVASSRPNILVIMTDEHNAGVMGCAGDPLARTPHLDALAARGVLFTAHYCSSPICIPSRQSFTTGKYVSRHNVWGNTVGVPDGTPSLPRLLNAAGYDSFLDGKMHYKGDSSLQEDISTEPGYQIVNDIRFGTPQVAPPVNLPQARLFPGVGLAALHTDVLNSSRDTAVYFRSSPFGAKGHMHANQNAFNLSRRGEPLFYSTGYYTSFADAHSMSSYRHTLAHNTILVNGRGRHPSAGTARYP